MIICLGRPSPAASSSLPAAQNGVGHTSPHIWPCSDWGLPCHRCCQRCGGLLPHRFTLTLCLRSGRFVFCGPVRRLAAPRRYLAVYPVELGLSSSRLPDPRSSRPACRGNIVRWGAAGLCVRPRPVRRDFNPRPAWRDFNAEAQRNHQGCAENHKRFWGARRSSPVEAATQKSTYSAHVDPARLERCPLRYLRGNSVSLR